MLLFVSLAFVCSFSLEAKGFNFEEDTYIPISFNRKPIPECPPNELYGTCISTCQDCEQRGQCLLERCDDGCDCAPRFFRKTPEGPCVPVALCPAPECGENEVFRECGPVCEKCTTHQCRIISCDHKCYCKEGYLRNKEGECIPEKECPKRVRCARTEEWRESGPLSEFCPEVSSQTDLNETQNDTQCYCKNGYKRDSLGYCTNETFCFRAKCFGDEIFYDCIPKCNTTCRNYNNPNCSEDDNCYPGCFCKSGYVMNDFRRCVPIQDCSLEIEHQISIKVEDEEEETSSETNATATGPSSSPPSPQTDEEDTSEEPADAGDEEEEKATTKCDSEFDGETTTSGNLKTEYATPVTEIIPAKNETNKTSAASQSSEATEITDIDSHEEDIEIDNDF